MARATLLLLALLIGAPTLYVDAADKYPATLSDVDASQIIERDRRVAAYFRQANENVGALACNQVIHERDVPESVKEYVKLRDGYRCIICGSTTELEVDHKRALMNGGNNDESNLATICDDCHTMKTRMDNSLRRKRARLCGNKRQHGTIEGH